MQRFEKLNNLTKNIFELKFYQDQNKGKQNLIPIEISKNHESDRFEDLLIYENHYILIEKLNVFLGDHRRNFICRRGLNSYTSENMLLIHKPKCGNYDITTTRTSSESHLHWKNNFYKTPIFFRIYADFEADNEIDNSSINKKTTNIYMQNPVLNGYHIESVVEDALQSKYHKSPLGYDNKNWYVDEL